MRVRDIDRDFELHEVLACFWQANRRDRLTSAVSQTRVFVIQFALNDNRHISSKLEPSFRLHHCGGDSRERLA